MKTESVFPIEKRNAPRAWLTDLYYRLVRMRWSYLLSFAFCFYMGVNLIYGTAYFFLREGLNPPGLGFAECFFFSVHTFSTVGYGSISPSSVPVHFVTVAEIFTGLVAMALFTGLCFAKFSRPSARFLFSDPILVTNYFGRQALVIRMANARTNRVMDAEVTLTIMHTEISSEGTELRRLDDLELDRAQTPVFVLSFTCAHYFEPGSATEKFLDRIRQGENIEFLVSIRGLDETFGQIIHGTKVYGPGSLVWGKQFEDILELRKDGTRVIDFAKFHKVKS